jgi:Tfp pilus assembly protein PilF
VSAFIGRGLAQESKNDYTRAIADFTQAIKVDPKNVAAYDERASAYEFTGAHDRALADIAQAIKLDPQNPDAHRLQ